MAMSEDEILELWEQISGYRSDWDSVILDLLDEIDNMRSQMPVSGVEEDTGGIDDATPDLESMRDSLVDLRRLIFEAVNSTLSGDMVQTELEEFFVKASATLSDLEKRVFEMRELTQEFDIYEMEEDIWREEEEEE